MGMESMDNWTYKNKWSLHLLSSVKTKYCESDTYRQNLNLLYYYLHININKSQYKFKTHSSEYNNIVKKN